jgi:hypothetical protein
VDPGSDAINVLDDPVDQLGRVLQLGTRIPAGGKGRSHECAAVVFL